MWSDLVHGSETIEGGELRGKAEDEQRKEGVLSCGCSHICYVHFLHDFASVSLILTISYCWVFMMVVDLVMVFFYVSVLRSGYMFQCMGGTCSLHFQGD